MTDSAIVRFLLARNSDVKLATRLLRETLPWWSKRNPGYVMTDPEDERAKIIEFEARTGKVCWGIEVILFDTEVLYSYHIECIC